MEYEEAQLANLSALADIASTLKRELEPSMTKRKAEKILRWGDTKRKRRRAVDMGGMGDMGDNDYVNVAVECDGMETGSISTLQPTEPFDAEAFIQQPIKHTKKRSINHTKKLCKHTINLQTHKPTGISLH